ncbi:MAG: hypothetical protein ABIH42_06165, partial [Planctomycetota bacterium]
LYLSTASWLFLWVGLKIKTNSRAIIITLILLLLWILGPLIMASLLYEFSIIYRVTSEVIKCISPAYIIAILETESPKEYNTDGMILNVIFHLFLLCFVIYKCSKNADYYLGRAVTKY